MDVSVARQVLLIKVMDWCSVCVLVLSWSVETSELSALLRSHLNLSCEVCTVMFSKQHSCIMHYNLPMTTSLPQS